MTSNPQDPLRELPVTEIIPPMDLPQLAPFPFPRLGPELTSRGSLGEFRMGTSEARTDRHGLLCLIAHHGRELQDLYRLLVGRHALQETPLHVTLGGAPSSSSEIPKAI